MSNEIAVSVVIPCFNHGQFIRDAIASVEKCDQRAYELIIVNDGSTDSYTQQVMNELEAEGYHVINQANQGLAAARNIGIRAGRGRYVLPLDADNLIRPNYIHAGTEILDKFPEVAVVYGRPAYFGEATDRRFDIGSEFDLRRLLRDNYIDACTVLRKSVFEACGGFDGNMPSQGYEDWDLWLTFAARGHHFYFVDEVLFDYRIRGDSMIHNAIARDEFPKVFEYFCAKHPLFALQARVTELERELANRDRSRIFRFAKAYWDFKNAIFARFSGKQTTQKTQPQGATDKALTRQPTP
jgi:glycosyltransferase involved in cell wall biosynthesis